MVYVGGIGTIFGPVGGALLLTLMTEGLRNFGEWRLMIYSVLLIVILFYLPNGVVAPVWKKIRAMLSSPVQSTNAQRSTDKSTGEA
jgi:branched-chain amino acid transport system permease protein